MGLPIIDYSSLTDAEVATLRSEASLEDERRRRIAQAIAKAEEISVEYLQDVGQIDGADWVQPTGALNCYPKGYTVHKDGKQWESLIPANVWEPGLDPRWWKDLTPVVDDGSWNPNYHEYLVGDEVVYNGISYKCLQAHTSQPGWEPSATPALWLDMTTIPEPPPVSGSADWDPNSKAYAVNDEVTYNGSTYKCIIAHTSQAGWTPSAVPALWQLL